MVNASSQSSDEIFAMVVSSESPKYHLFDGYLTILSSKFRKFIYSKMYIAKIQIR